MQSVKITLLLRAFSEDVFQNFYVRLWKPLGMVSILIIYTRPDQLV